MGKNMIAVRDVDEEIFRKFKARVVEGRMKLGKALTLAMKNWIKEREERKVKPDPRNLLKLKGIIKTKKRVRWSEEIDEILYGGKL